MTIEERSYYTIAEAAALLGVSRVSVWRWVRDGRLPASRLGHRTTRIKRDDLERILEQARFSDARSPVFADWKVPPDAKAGANHRPVPSLNWTELSAAEHIVQFYETDAFLLRAVGEFIGAALRAGDVGIVIATTAQRTGFEERFQAEGLDLAAARASGRYISLDAFETLSRFMVDRTPDPQRFSDVVGSIIAQAPKGHRVRVFGSMVTLLVADGNQTAAIRLEELWNELQKTHAFSLFCGYPLAQFGGEAFSELFTTVSAAHSCVIPAEGYTTLPTEDERLRAIATLQQKARWLESEVEERKRAEERLRVALSSERAARQEVEAALRLRDEFVSIAAHELKTPLTSLSANAQLVLRWLAREVPPEPERVRQALTAVTDQTDKLSRLISQLLDISRLEAGKLMLERQPIDLTALVEQAVAYARTMSDRHAITVAAPASLNAEIDPLRLEQVLTNLLDNAIKYSPDGGPIEVVLSRSGPTEVELSVRDHGLGIPPEKRDRIFERFYQAHGNEHQIGMGLGLYISRQIVELHGGEIRAEFPPDGGTHFVVRLPFALDVRDAPRAAD